MHTLPYKAILFDLDGTLIDTVDDLAAAVNQTLAHYNAESLATEVVRTMIGKGVGHLIGSALAYRDVVEYDLAQALVYFDQAYSQTNGQASVVYPGVRATLARLHGQHTFACVTNKPRKFSEALLEACGLRDYFQVLVCGDDVVHKKPHAEPILKASALCGVSPEHVLFVGDSVNDVQAAKAAGVVVYCVGYGYEADDAALAQADRLIDNFDAL